jgi:hypothetical protein
MIRMFVLAVTASLRYKPPTLCFDLLDDVPNLHVCTVRAPIKCCTTQAILYIFKAQPLATGTQASPDSVQLRRDLIRWPHPRDFDTQFQSSSVV